MQALQALTQAESSPNQPYIHAMSILAVDTQATPVATTWSDNQSQKVVRLLQQASSNRLASWGKMLQREEEALLVAGGSAATSPQATQDMQQLASYCNEGCCICYGAYTELSLVCIAEPGNGHVDLSSSPLAATSAHPTLQKLPSRRRAERDGLISVDNDPR